MGQWRSACGPREESESASAAAALPSALADIDLAPDGRRLLALVPEHAAPGAVMIVESWRAALSAKR